MSYTPRQLAAFVTISARLDQIDAARDLATFAMASRGEPREVKKRLKELQR